MQIRAIASKIGYLDSPIMTENYTILPPVPAFVIGIGGTYSSQFIHMSDGRTYVHGYDNYTLGCCTACPKGPNDYYDCPTSAEWWRYDCDDSDGNPHLICTEGLLTSEGDSWNDCVYHVDSNGRGWFTGDEEIYCRGGCPHYYWDKLYRMVLTDATDLFIVGETIEDDDMETTYLTYKKGIVTAVSGTPPNVTLELYMCASPNFTSSTGPFTGKTSGAKATAVDMVDLGYNVEDYKWEARWDEGQLPCGEWDNWLEEPTPYGGDEDPTDRDYRALRMFPEDIDLVKMTGMGHGGIGLDANGKIWTWGYRGWGIIGRDDPYNNRMVQCVPYNVKPEWDWIDVAGGYFHCAAIRSDGTLWTWGINSYDQLGTGAGYSGVDSWQGVPVQVPGVTDAVKVWAPHENTVIQKSDGTVWYTGSNQYGQYGDSYAPDACYYIYGDPGGSLSEGMRIGGGGKSFVLFSAGSTSSVGVDADGVTWTWGYGDYGALGTGVDYNALCERYWHWCQFTPIQVSGVPAFDMIWTDGGSVIGAVSDTGEVWYWGELTYSYFSPQKMDFDFISGE